MPYLCGHLNKLVLVEACDHSNPPKVFASVFLVIALELQWCLEKGTGVCF